MESEKHTLHACGGLSLAAVGTSPNADAATLVGCVLRLEPCDGSNPGVVTSGTQTLGGNKTFTGSVTANGGLTGSPLTLGTTAGFSGVIEASSDAGGGSIEFKISPAVSLGKIQLDGSGYPAFIIPDTGELIANYFYASDAYNTGITLDPAGAGASLYSDGPVANTGAYVALVAGAQNPTHPWAILARTQTTWTTGDLLRVDNNTTHKLRVDFDGNGTFAGEVTTQNVQLPAIATPATPVSGSAKIYLGTDGKLHFVDDTGTDHVVTST
jgi:hypothetical protein